MSCVYIPVYVPSREEGQNSTGIEQRDIVVLEEEVRQAEELGLVQTASVISRQCSYNQHLRSCVWGEGGRSVQ